MQGAGNDYIYVDASLYHIEDPASAAIAWSDRHNGIGADGLVLIGRADTNDADFTMRIFNADGSEARMCGNASRCIGKYVFEKGLTTKTKIRLQTLSGVKTLMLKPSSSLEPAESGGIESVTVDMGKPVLADEKQFRPMESLMEGTFVSMGNPHYVIFTADVDQVEELGSKLEFHEAFPQRCNIEFAHVEADGQIRMRVWERGSGVTMACGTGACATAVAVVLTGRGGRRSNIVMDGGTLSIEWNEQDGHVYMTGPAEFVFDGEIEINS
jgi:diaminopimelate epimerase